MHESYQRLDDHLHRTLDYARLGAEDLIARGQPFRAHKLLLSPLGRLVRSLVIQQAWRDGWRGILFTRDIFDDTLQLADAHLTIFWRSVKLSLMTTLITFLVGFPTAWFIATRPAKARAFWLFLITIPFWTNMLIRAFAIQEVIRNEGILNTLSKYLVANR